MTAAGAGFRDYFRLSTSDGLRIAAVAAAYFLLAKAGLALASISPSASPIWPPTGLALAAILLGGPRYAPGILIAAFAANVLTAGNAATAFAIACGNTLECLAGGWLVARYAGGRYVFESPSNIAKFAGIALVACLISASVGAATLRFADIEPAEKLASIWFTWWAGDVAGALVVTPLIVLWAKDLDRPTRGAAEIAAIYGAALLVGLVAFSPLLPQDAGRGPLGFLAIVPLLAAALRLGQRDTATVALALSCFAIWGTLVGSGPFAQSSLNDSFLLLLMFMISASVPSLALSADAAMRARTERRLLDIQQGLDRKVRRRSGDLAATSHALQHEIDQRLRVEDALLLQTTHLLEAQRLANLGSWVWDVGSGGVTWSDSLHVIYGLKPGEFRGTIEDFVGRLHPDDRPRVQAEVTRAIGAGGGFRHRERIVRPDGEVRHLQSSGEVILDPTGKPQRMLGICQDITDLVLAESELEHAREHLAQARKMEALGQLTGGIAHDFNNLLMIVSGHAQLLRKRLTGEKELASIDAVQSAADRGERLTRQLLAFSRRQLLSPEVIDLRARIDTMSELLCSSLRDNIRLNCEIPDDTWPVQADAGELDLALVNVAVNARDAMPKGGTFTLSARNERLAPALGSDLAGEFVALTLADNGTGIAPDVLPRVFEPFFTTKDVGKGTGLGLSQVYGFVQRAGGKAAVLSEEGRGTAITLYLPRSSAPPRAARPEETADKTEPGHGLVLAIDDNPAVAEVTASLIEQFGYRVLRADNAADALRHLQKTPVDLVLSDIVMPGAMDGIALAHEIRRRHPGLPVVLTSGFSEAAQAAESDFPVLQKPYDLATLERILRETLAGRRSGAARATQP